MRTDSILLLSLLLLALSCSDNPSVFGPDASDADSDSDNDTDSDSDIDTDSDSDTDTDTDTETCVEVEWVVVEGGVFMMGGPEDTMSGDRLPIHEVTVPSFEMTRTEVTAAEYRCCFLEGACTEPQPPGYEPDTDDPWASLENCNWDLQEEDDRPINCVNWQQAVDFCTWAGGRLPSEAEWEYAARSQGQNVTYPWGEEEPSCDLCVMNDAMGMPGCDEERTWDVCSKPSGNTEQGLCDMAGNVHEWVQDCYHPNYDAAPVDGSAWTTGCPSPTDERIIRGASFIEGSSTYFEVAERGRSEIEKWFVFLGIRCAR
jgi:formylglycine-generating enzyme required for sulfatase activity